MLDTNFASSIRCIIMYTEWSTEFFEIFPDEKVDWFTQILGARRMIVHVTSITISQEIWNLSPFISGRKSRLENVWTQSLKKIPLNTVLALLTITWSPINSSKILQTDPQGFWLSLHEVLFRPNIVHPVSCLETDQK